MKRIVLWGALALGLAAALVHATSVAHAGRELGGGRHLDRMADDLGLDEATRGEIVAIFEASRESAEPLRAALEDAHFEMEDLMASEPLDEAAVLRQVEVIGAARTEMRKHQLLTLFEVRALLTPEQRARMRERHWERQQERRERWGRHRDGFGDEGPGAF